MVMKRKSRQSIDDWFNIGNQVGAPDMNRILRADRQPITKQKETPPGIG
jgi:hypothetical protein